MRSSVKYLIVYCLAVCLLIAMALQLASAQEFDASQSEPDQQVVILDQQQLDQILAPIALYPDSLLSHILIASTYPLEVIQASRWRQKHQDLDQQEVMDAVEDMSWDPSVKALAPFNDLLLTLSEDLEWLENLGNAFLADETAVLASVQGLRQKAYELGNLADNDYIQVEEDEGEIVIQPVEKEVVYIPYYDTRVIYGPWWHSYPPYYWQQPANYVWHSGFYWSNSIFISPAFYFGGFHWHNRHTVVDYRWRNSHGHHRYHSAEKIVRSHEYQRWQHNPAHRRGARYINNHYDRNKMRQLKVVRSQEMRKVNSAPVAASYVNKPRSEISNTNKTNYAEKHYRQDPGEIKQKLREQQKTGSITKPAVNDKMRRLEGTASFKDRAYRSETAVREHKERAPLATVSSQSAHIKSAHSASSQAANTKVQRYQQREDYSRQSLPKAAEYKVRESRDPVKVSQYKHSSSERAGKSAKQKDR